MRRVLETIRVARIEQGFVVGEFGRHRRPGKRKDDHFLEAVEVRELPVKRQQDIVDHEEAIVRVARDPADLVRRQAQVQSVHHAAGGGDAEVALQVRMVVPAQRGDAVALLQAESLQR